MVDPENKLEPVLILANGKIKAKTATLNLGSQNKTNFFLFEDFFLI